MNTFFSQNRILFPLKVLLFLVIICSFTYCNSSGQPKRSKSFLFVDSLLQKDSFTVEFLDFEYPKEILDIATRFQLAVAEKKDWFEEYVSKNDREGEDLPYHEDFGVTKEEYQKIIDMNNVPPKIVVKKALLLKANRNANVFSFTTTDKDAKFFEFLRIDFKNEVLIFNNIQIPYRSEINAPSNTPFGEWHGYSWEKSSYNKGENDDLKFDSLIGKSIEVDFGVIKSSNKVLLRLKYKDVYNGKVNANLDLPCYLN